MSTQWPAVKLAEVLHHVAHPVTVLAEQAYREIGIRSHGRGIFHKPPITGLELGNKRVFWLTPGDFVLNIVFAWEGAIGILGESEAGMIGSHRFPTFQAEKSRLDLRFLRAYLGTPEGLNLLGRVSPGGAGRNRTLSRSAFLEQTMPLPPLSEQRRIVAWIEELSTQIDEARTLRHQQQIEMQQCLLGVFWRIARDAPRYKMQDVAPVIRRPVEIDPEGVYPELGIRSFGKGTFHKLPLNGLELGTKRIFEIEPGDLLFMNVFAWEGAVAVAQPQDKGRYGSHRFISCIPRPHIATSMFLCFYFLTDEGLGKILSASPGGAGRNRTLGLAALGDIEVPVPTMDQQYSFDELQAEMDRLKHLQAETTAELDALRQSIVDRAFRGDL